MPNNESTSLNTAKLIVDDSIVDNDWNIIESLDFDVNTIKNDEKVVLPVAVWLESKEQLAAKDNIGVWLNSGEEPALIAEYCSQLQIICINFPVFADGRGYSYARQLRNNYAYEGELRAIGDVLKDQLFFYARCGFNSYAIRQDRDLEDALASLNDFEFVYQGAADSKTVSFLRS